MKLLNEKPYKTYWNNKPFTLRINLSTKTSLRHGLKVYQLEDKDGVLFLVPEKKIEKFLEKYDK